MTVPADRPDHQTAEVLILLAMYRSPPDWLRAQLDSYAAQRHPGWRLIISDDGPLPASAAVLDGFAATHPGRILARHNGPQAGFAANFLSLLRRVPQDAAWVALSDHDDVWFPDKLDRALTALSALPADVPALYAAATEVTDEHLRGGQTTRLFRRPATFGNALVQSIGGGNTMMLNAAAIALARAAAAEAGPIIAHDWWLYQIVSGAGGQIIRDPVPVLAYRQHGGNAIGANRSLRSRLARVGFGLGGRFRRWMAVSTASLERSAHRLTPTAQAQLSAFVAARCLPLWRPDLRLAALRRAGVYRQSRAGDAALVVACVLGLI